MIKEEIKKNKKVVDRWYPEKGIGTITQVLKTVIKISFGSSTETWDYQHAKEFLDTVK